MIHLAKLLTPLALLAFAVLRCTSHSPLAGGSEVGNSSTVSGIATYQGSNEPVKNAVVRLRPADYVADTSRDDFDKPVQISYDIATDNSGYFHIDSIPEGNYWIEINDEAGFAAIAKVTIELYDSALVLPPVKLKPVSRLEGTILFGDQLPQCAFVQVYGLERLVIPDDIGNFTVELPADTHSLRVISDEITYRPLTMRHLSTTSDSTRIIPSLTLYGSCNSGECDSLVVRAILDTLELSELTVNERVTRTSDRRVTGIDLDGLSISRIPFLINKLTELTSVSANSNLFTSIPLSVFSVSKLEVLRMRNNLLRVIPDEIAWTPALITLDIGNNELTTIADEVAYLPNLSLFACDSNLLTVVADEVGLLLNLKSFNASHNQLAGLPSRMANLTRLEELLISYNDFSALPALVMQLNALVTLDIDGNSICDPTEGTKAYLDSLVPGWYQRQLCN